MGLTIHYGLKYQGNNPKEPLEILRDYIKRFPIDKVSELYHIEGEQCDYQKNNNDNLKWLLIQAQTWHDYEENGHHYSQGISPIELYAFSVEIGEGCEEANFGLCHYPNKRGWAWHSFCKTQYAREFLKCHIAIITFLDKAKELGILKKVNDEGEYWNKRDIRALAKEVGEWDAMIAKQVGQLMDTFGRDNIAAPILERPNFEHLEMGKMPQ